MSGHGGFNAIPGGINMPPVVNPPPVADVKPTGDAPGVPNAGCAKFDAPVPSPEAEQAGRLVSKLDMMLLRAAKTVAKPVDAEALKETTAALPKKMRKAIDKAAEKAGTAFLAINRYSGRQLAAALAKDANGRFSWDLRNPAGKAIKAALDAQAKLSEELAKAFNALPSDTPGTVRTVLEEALLRNDRRASEIQTLVCEFADLAEKEGADPAIAARLDRTLASLLPAQSLSMHGSEKIAANFRASLLPLARSIDDLAAASKERQLSGDETTAIRRQIDEASNALARAERTYAEKGTPLDPELFQASRNVLADFRKRLDDVKRSVALGSMRKFADRTFSPPAVPILQKRFAPILKALFPALAAVADRQRKLREAALAYIENPTSENRVRADALARQMAGLRSKVDVELGYLEDKCVPAGYDLEDLDAETMDVLLETLQGEDRARCTDALVADFRREVRAFLKKPQPTLDALKAAYGGLKGAATQTEHLFRMREAADRKDASRFLTNKTLEAAFEGKIAVTTLVETRLSGLPDEDADPSLDASNVVSSRTLGQGAVNTVYEVGYKDGRTFIFKPEAPGRQAIQTLTLSNGAYEDHQLVAQFNMAAQRTADAFGLGDVMTTTTVGAHDGQFGMFMEKAPGTEAASFGKLKRSDGHLTASQIRNLDDAQYAKVVGGIMRKLNRLEWFDLLTGQGDRHGRNYLLDVYSTGESSVKGIDNDACFGKFLVGPGIFMLQGKQAEDFKTQLLNAKTVFQKPELERDPGVGQLQNGAILVDLSKLKSKEIIHCVAKATGSHAVRVPDFIDEELYAKLVSMKSGKARDDYVAGLRARLSEDQVAVAEMRLDKAIEHAEKLKERNCVVSAADWEKREIQRKVAGSPPKDLPTYDGTSKRYAEYAQQTQNSIRRSCCLFRRDLLRHIGKPGWFEE